MKAVGRIGWTHKVLSKVCGSWQYSGRSESPSTLIGPYALRLFVWPCVNNTHGETKYALLHTKPFFVVVILLNIFAYSSEGNVTRNPSNQSTRQKYHRSTIHNRQHYRSAILYWKSNGIRFFLNMGHNGSCLCQEGEREVVVNFCNESAAEEPWLLWRGPSCRINALVHELFSNSQ